MEDFDALLEIQRLLDAGDIEGAQDLLLEVIEKNIPPGWKPEVPFPDPIYGAGYAHASGYHD